MDVFNPFTGELETLNPGLNDIYRFGIGSPGPLSWFVWELVYDPSLTRLVYLREDRDQVAAPIVENTSILPVGWLSDTP